MWPSAFDVLAATALLAHASLVPAGAGVVAALLVPRRGAVLAAAGHHERRAEQLRHLASTGQLDRSPTSAYDASAAERPPPPAVAAADQPTTDPEAEARRGWIHAAATCTAAAGLVHAAAGPHHAAEHPTFGAFFVLAAFLQFAWTARALLGPGPGLLTQGIALNVTLVVLWATTRTLGLPFGLLHHHEAIGAWDLAATAWELGAVLCCVALLLQRGGSGGPAPPRLAVPVLALGSVMVVLALALTGAPA